MTPKEKAIHLAQKFEGLTASPFDGKGNLRLNESAKQRALICVDEILSAKYDCGCEQSIVVDGKYQTYTTYWQQVKTEIEKL